MKKEPKKILKLIEVLFVVASCLLFAGCEQMSNFLNELNGETNENITIEKSGLAENKYLTGTIDGNECDIILFANNGRVVATKSSRAAKDRASTSNSYEGYFVYNSNSKTVLMYITGAKKKYLKTDVDLSGTKGKDSSKPVSVTFTSSNKTEFQESIETVSSLPVETTIDKNDDNGGNGNGDNPGDNDNPGGNTNPTENQEQTTNTPPYTKNVSTYKSGRRAIDLSSKKEGNGVEFVSKIQPAAKPDYSSVDNAVKNLSIPITTKISDAAKLIVSTANATTQKEKVRALYTWMAHNIKYEYESSNPEKYTALGAWEKRSAVCSGFAYLMQEMCSNLNIDCVFVVGVAKAWYPNDDKQQKASIFKSDHAWNLIKADTGDFLIDVTWASNYAEGGSEKFGVWFDTDPCYFITSHYPTDDEYRPYTQSEVQLLDPIVSREDFITLPQIDPSLEYAGIDGKEILEFVGTHLETWMPGIIVSPSAKNANIYKMPLISCIPFENDKYEISYLYDGKYTSITTSYKNQTQTFTCGNIRLDYDFNNYSNALSTVRDEARNWFKVYTEHTAPEIKGNTTASMNDKGEITLNGYKFSKTGMVPIIPKNKTVKIDGNLPVAKEPVVAPGTHYDELDNDNAFPIGRKVGLSAFEMAKYPVTVELYKKVMESVVDFGGLTEPVCRSIVRRIGEDGKIDETDYRLRYDSRGSLYPLNWPTDDGHDWFIQYVGDNEGHKFILMDYKPVYENETEYLQDYVTGISEYEAMYFCNALTKLLMSEEDCVYSITDVEWLKAQPYGISKDITEAQITEWCTKFGVPKENIISMWIDENKTNTVNGETFWIPLQSAIYGGRPLNAYIYRDYSKKGFRLPTDAEWEFAARGADPSAESWAVEHYMTEADGNANSIGLVDLFVKNRFGRWYNTHSAASYDAEYVMDWLTSNTDYEEYAANGMLAYSSYKDENGYVWNPLYEGNCRSVRRGTSSRKMVNNEYGHGTLYRLRVVRNIAD